MSKQQQERQQASIRRSRRHNNNNNNKYKMTTILSSSMLILLLIVLILSPAVQATPLLNGRYETVTDVTSYLNLALDAADMKETSDITTKQNIYRNVSKA